MDDDALVLEYSSLQNITFRGEVKVRGITRAEFDQMDGVEQDNVITEALYGLVDIGVKD